MTRNMYQQIYDDRHIYLWITEKISSNSLKRHWWTLSCPFIHFTTWGTYPSKDIINHMKLIIIIISRSQQTFAHTKTTELSWYMQNFVVIRLIWGKISINLMKKIWNLIKMSSVGWVSDILGWEVVHYGEVIMGTMASQITSLTIVYSTVYSDADQRRHQSSASLAYVWGIHRGPVNYPHKWPVMRKMFPFDDVIMAPVW